MKDSVYIVILSVGRWEGAYTKNLGAYKDEHRAHYHAKTENDKIGRQVVLYDTMSRLIGDWARQQPQDSIGTEAYMQAEDAEYARLSDIIGYNIDDLPQGATDYFHAYVEEMEVND